MALKTNLKSLAPRRQVYKKLINMPSGGYTNPQAWPEGKIWVYPWDSDITEQLIELTRSAGQNNTVLFDLIEKLCDLNGGKVDDLIAEEATVILLVAKNISELNTPVNYTSTCPYCGSRSVESIRIPDDLERVACKAADYPGYDTITLPNCGDVVQIRPLQVKDEKEVLGRSPADKLRVPDSTLKKILRIVTINGSTADSLLEYKAWIDAIPPLDARFLEEQADSLTPRLNSTIKHKCDNPACTREFKHTLTFDTEFFR